MKKLIFLGLFASIAYGEEVSIWDLPDTPYNSIASVHFVTNLLDNAISNLDSKLTADINTVSNNLENSISELSTNVVHLTGDENINGVKTFNDSIETPEISSSDNLILNPNGNAYIGAVEVGSRLVTVNMLSNEVEKLNIRIDDIAQGINTNLVDYINAVSNKMETGIQNAIQYTTTVSNNLSGEISSINTSLINAINTASNNIINYVDDNYALDSDVVHATYDHDAYWISAGLNVETDGYRLTFDDDGLVLTDSESKVAITANSISVTNTVLNEAGLDLGGNTYIYSNPTDGIQDTPIISANGHSYYAPSESGFIAITTNPTGRVDVDLSGYVTYHENTLYLDPEVEYDLNKFPTYEEDTLYLGGENHYDLSSFTTYSDSTIYLGEENSYNLSSFPTYLESTLNLGGTEYNLSSFPTYEENTLYLGGENSYYMPRFPTWERENNINYLHLQDGDEYVYNLDDFVVHSELSAFPTYSGTTLYLGNNPYDMDDGLFYNRDSHNIKKLNINTASGLSGIYVNSESLQDTFNAVSNNITADLIEYTSTNYLKVSYADSYAYITDPNSTRGIYLQNSERPFLEVKDISGMNPLSKLTSGGLDINPQSEYSEVTRYAYNEIITGFDPFNTSSNGNHIVFPDHSGTLALAEDIEDRFDGVVYLASDISQEGEKHISFDTELDGTGHSYVVNASDSSVQLDLDGSQYETYTSTYINDNFATKENTIESILEDGTYRVPCEGFVFETTNGVESIYIGNDSLSDIIKNTYMGNTIYSGSSASLATDTNKIVTLSDNEFTIVNGDLFMVVFDKGNTRAQITMSVNGSDSYPVHRNKDDGTSTAYSWYPGELVGFLFNGDSFIMLDGGIATTSFYGVTVLNNSVSDSEVTAATPKAVKTALTTAQNNITAVSNNIMNSIIGSYVPLVEDNQGNKTAVTIGYRQALRNDLGVGEGSLVVGSFNAASGFNSIAMGYATYSTNYNAFVWQGNDNNDRDNYYDHGGGSFNINPVPANNSEDPATGFYIGETNLADYIDSRVQTQVEAIINRMVETGGINRNGTNYVLVIQPFTANE